MDRADSFTSPESLAVIGASNKSGKIGHEIMKNIIESGYRGKLFPVNPKEKEILGVACYPSLDAVNEKVDAAIFTVPSARVLEAARECGQKGVKNLVVITAGFKEVGPTGMDLEKELLSICRKYRMRMLGPNCVGFLDTHAPLNATFLKGFPNKGEIAFISQSGAILASILDWSMTSGLGYSKIFSLGNKADLNEVDCIVEAAEDPNTRVILCYIEDVSNGPEFVRVISEVTRTKPVVILKAGTSPAGAQAASSHTGALAGSDMAYETAFKRCGVLRARTMSELFDLAIALTGQSLPEGDGIAVVTNSGGPGILAADKIEAQGLRITRFSKETLADLRRNLPVEASIYNPVDVLGDARADRFSFALEKVLEDDHVDSAVLMMCPVAVTQPVETALAMIDLNKKYRQKPLLAAYMGGSSLAEGAQLLNSSGIPCYAMPEPAIDAMNGLIRYARIKSRPLEEPVVDSFEPDYKKVKDIFYDVRRDNRLALLGCESMRVARAYGIATPPTILTQNPQEAALIAEKIGYPVAMKVASPKILHKTDVGGVMTGLNSAGDVEIAYMKIIENVHRYLPRVVPHGIEVQKMVPQGVELITGMTRDMHFGPMIAFGLGGIYVNLVEDVSFKLAVGLTKSEIRDMISETKAYTLMKGYRGKKPVDIEAVTLVIQRVARMATDFPEITDIDINPLFAYESGLTALDVKITLSEVEK